VNATTSSTLDRAALDQLCINTIRTLSMDAVQKANSGHPGAPMGLAPLAYVLWTRHMRYNPRNPKWVDRDRFVLSAGHASILLYAMLYLTGYDLTLDDLKRFRQWGSKTPGHPEYGETPGVECTTGPLGQGCGNAVGFAIAERYLAARFNKGGVAVVDHHTYVICSDGDMMEGISGEAGSLAGHLQLGKLIMCYDDNHISLDGPTTLSFDQEDVCRRYEAYGWHTQAVEDINDIEAVDRAIVAAKADPRPSFIRFRSHIGYGAPNKQDTNEAHGEPLGEAEVRGAKRFYGWPEDAQFLVPDEALAEFRKAVERGARFEAEWNERWTQYAREQPGLAAEFLAEQAGMLPPEWTKRLPVFAPSDGPMATRDASAKALNAIAKAYPAFIGGAADLATSNKTNLNDLGDFAAGSYDGHNLHFGVREHAMGAALTGMALHGGVRPFGGTFLIFSDYMRPAIRLACLQHADPLYVWTHDSIGLGEDGPTHEPIEQLASLRAIPNMTLMRPADANETSICYRLAMEHTGGPVGFALTRQKLPVLDPAMVQGTARGGYVLAAESGGALKLILIATGSEVSLCLAAREMLQGAGLPTRVVSLPCWQIFDAQDQAYRDGVLPPAVWARVSVEAASPFGWERYVGARGRILGINRFGASAPGPVNMEKFGFTPDNVARVATSLIALM
jgi:transketolase